MQFGITGFKYLARQRDIYPMDNKTKCLNLVMTKFLQKLHIFHSNTQFLTTGYPCPNTLVMHIEMLWKWNVYNLAELQKLERYLSLKETMRVE